MRPHRAALIGLFLLLPSAVALRADATRQASAHKAGHPDRHYNRAKARARVEPWLLFPVDAFNFRHESSGFGPRKLRGHSRVHRGIDLAAPEGSWAVAAREGVVDKVEWDPGKSGFWLKLKLSNGCYLVYCHLARNPRDYGVVPGMSVVAGQFLGFVGESGHGNTGPHLHFMLLDSAGRAIDPEPFLLSPKNTVEYLAAARSQP